MGKEFQLGHGGDPVVVVAGLAAARAVFAVEDDLELEVWVRGDGGVDVGPGVGAVGRVDVKGEEEEEEEADG